ncbi:SDR family NAD(P)-dependent oxidoreductase [Echinicola sp. 20G]|uniref:SDR family NAD(P)-dependent oxidoreductase n=1 Tax=Echinicola sp. 20G TaxID=2781961 RepID=UPI001910E214|nr:SDR family NAD(P)-dependent oxidoreductase [Echinicola sp. 20G]
MKTIFITGASRGFGRLWTEALLQRGDRVIATSRNVSNFSDLKELYPETFVPVALDITNRKEVFETVKNAHSHWGSLDVVINNAGYGVFGATEELSEKDSKEVVNVNLFGTLWVTQAVLPFFRSQGNGHLIQLSSVLGLWALPTLGLYSATKFAVEGLTEALAQEVEHFGIHLTLVEPNGYATNFAGDSAVLSQPIPDYEPVRIALAANEGMQASATGIPEATVPALLQLIDSENPPLRYFLGKVGLQKTKQVYAERLSEWEKYNQVAIDAHGK